MSGVRACWDGFEKKFCESFQKCLGNEWGSIPKKLIVEFVYLITDYRLIGFQKKNSLRNTTSTIQASDIHTIFEEEYFVCYAELASAKLCYVIAQQVVRPLEHETMTGTSQGYRNGPHKLNFQLSS